MKDPLAEKSPAVNQHLDNFLRDQILSQKSGGRAKGQRSAVSVASSKRSNALIEMATAAKYNGRKKSMHVSSRRNDAADT